MTARSGTNTTLDATETTNPGTGSVATDDPADVLVHAEACADCGASFAVTGAEQAWYREHGRRQPERCPTCRALRRAERNAPLLAAYQAEATTAAERGVTVYGGPGHRGPAAPRHLYPATCHACGAETEVPFLPRGNRPVYCRDCFSQRRG